MALFGKADAGLPLLTRFYQASIPELSDFAWDEDDELTPKGLEELTSLHRLVVLLMDALADASRVPAGVLKEIEPRLHGLTRQQLRLSFAPTEADEAALATGHAPGYPLHDGADEYRPPPGLPRMVCDCPDEYPIPVEELFLRPVSEIRRAVAWRVVADLHTLLTQPPQERPRFLRCAECKNPFVNERRGQKFCSHRCRTRVSVRRQRSK